MKISDWLKKANKLLKKNNNNKEAEIFLEFVIKKPIVWIKTFDDYILNQYQLKILNELLERRALKEEPVAYIIKECYFWSLKLYIYNIAMIPRVESEILVEKALEFIPYSSYVLELGCGCGAITLALAKERPDCIFFGTDVCFKLINLSKYNAKKLNIKNVFFKYSNWFSELKNIYFDIIISNPPYIDICDPHIFIGDLRFEPLTALVSSDKGLFDIKLITSQAKLFLKNKRYIIFEHGWNQAKKVNKILKKNSFTNIFTKKDYFGCNRITGGMLIK